MTEMVNHPAHYGGDTVYEVVKVAEAWGFDKDAYLFNVLKYIARPGKGQHLQDLNKALWYLQRKIRRLEQQVTPEAPVEAEEETEAVAAEEAAEIDAIIQNIGERLSCASRVPFGRLVVWPPGDKGDEYPAGRCPAPVIVTLDPGFCTFADIKANACGQLGLTPGAYCIVYVRMAPAGLEKTYLRGTMLVEQVMDLIHPDGNGRVILEEL